MTLHSKSWQQHKGVRLLGGLLLLAVVLRLGLWIFQTPVDSHPVPIESSAPPITEPSTDQSPVQSQVGSRPPENPIPMHQVLTPTSASGANPANFVDPSTVARLSSEDKARYQTLTQILKSKNDNDPRMDRDLKNLSPALKNAIRDLYSQLPMENHNERGTLVMLLGRSIQTPEDLKFVEKVFQEPPCLGLNDCKVRDPGNDPHQSSVDATTLSYSQKVALYQLDQLLQKPGVLDQPGMREKAEDVLRTAEGFPVPSVRQEAARVRQAHKL